MLANRRDPHAAAAALVRAHVAERIPAEILRLYVVSLYDLWHGPIAEAAPLEPDVADLADYNGARGLKADTEWIYPGWSDASEAVLDWFRAEFGTLYVDPDCDCVGEHEPEGWEDPEGGMDDDGNPCPAWVDPEPYYVFDRADIMRAYLGREYVSNA